MSTKSTPDTIRRLREVARAAHDRVHRYDCFSGGYYDDVLCAPDASEPLCSVTAAAVFGYRAAVGDCAELATNGVPVYGSTGQLLGITRGPRLAAAIKALAPKEDDRG